MLGVVSGGRDNALGKFITFEGGEGAGKSTQIEFLARRLNDVHGVDVVVTREPGGTALGEKVRNIILEGRPAARETEFLLFAAARAEHVSSKIAPALNSQKWVLCDRFIDSTRVYQGYLAGIPPDFIKAVETFATGDVFPDLTIVLDVPADLSIERARARGALSRYDAGSKKQHELLRDGFLTVARSEPRRCVVVNGARGVDEVADEVFDLVSKRFFRGKA